MTYPSDTSRSVWSPPTPSSVRAAQWLWFVSIVMIVLYEVLVVVGAESLAQELAIQETPDGEPVPVVDAAAVEQYLADQIPWTLLSMVGLLLVWWLAVRLGHGRRFARWLLAVLSLFAVLGAGQLIAYYVVFGVRPDLYYFHPVVTLLDAVVFVYSCCAAIAGWLPYTASARPHFVHRFRV